LRDDSTDQIDYLFTGRKTQNGSPEEYFEAILRSTARTSNLLQRQTPERLTAIRDHVCLAASAYRKAGKVLLPMPANLAWATKP
jgi:hypothetical protein